MWYGSWCNISCWESSGSGVNSSLINMKVFFVTVRSRHFGALLQISAFFLSFSVSLDSSFLSMSQVLIMVNLSSPVYGLLLCIGPKRQNFSHHPTFQSKCKGSLIMAWYPRTPFYEFYSCSKILSINSF